MSNGMTTAQTTNLFGRKYNSLQSKFDLLFDKNSTEWVSEQPAPGRIVYVCYACKDMFYSKRAFQDHINRRVVVLNYNCPRCCNLKYTFYNRCSFLMHTRNHFQFRSGTIDLRKLEVESLPLGLGGFLPEKTIPKLYEVEDDSCDKDAYINPQFYNANFATRGEPIVRMEPTSYLYMHIDASGSSLLTLKQISLNIPRCEFVTAEELNRLILLHMNKYPAEFGSNSEPNQILPITNQISLLKSAENKSSSPKSVEIKTEPPDGDNSDELPVLSNAKPIPKDDFRCTECKIKPNSLMHHFLGSNNPKSNLKCLTCHYVASTKCSLQAHIRMHSNKAPFVCPDCGNEFENNKSLKLHVDYDCFHHFSKNLRIRCPAKRCGKLFTVSPIFRHHFEHHMNMGLECNICHKKFDSYEKFEDHNVDLHGSKAKMQKVHFCTVCENETGFNDAQFKEHLNFHLNDYSRYSYVYVCRFCRNYFRSVSTYETHLLRCSKIARKGVESVEYVSASCKVCKKGIIFRSGSDVSICRVCREKQRRIHLLQKPSKILPKSAMKFLCILCSKQLFAHEKSQHMRQCKYSKPRVKLEPLEGDFDDISVSSNEDSSNGSKRKSPINLFSTPKKRLRPKKLDLTADKPMAFDGTYHCKVCKFKHENRQSFHEHIIQHRTVSTAYQCMECGECLVVKPSLIKHLKHFHQIIDSEKYFEENDCFDKEALKELEENMKLVPGESKEPVKENQCRVCREQFDNETELSKHFRIHGMAFLLKNSK